MPAHTRLRGSHRAPVDGEPTLADGVLGKLPPRTLCQTDRGLLHDRGFLQLGVATASARDRGRATVAHQVNHVLAELECHGDSSYRSVTYANQKDHRAPRSARLARHRVLIRASFGEDSLRLSQPVSARGPRSAAD